VTELVATSRIRPGPANARESLGDLSELAASIKVHGILQPIVVQPHPQFLGMFLILAGHRRFAAAKTAGLDEVPIVIREKAGPAKAIQVSLVENLQRADLNPMERAEGLGRLRDMGMTGRQIAAAIGQGESSVSMYLTMLELPETARVKIRNGEVNRADAVREARSIRAKSGRQRLGAPVGSASAACAALHFTGGHPLAASARHMCDTEGHPLKRRIGKVACGQCWEAVIRMDECGAPIPVPEPKAEPLVPGSPEWIARRNAYQRAYTERKRASTAQEIPAPTLPGGWTSAQAREQTLGWPCPSCAAPAGTACRTKGGDEAEWPHIPRHKPPLAGAQTA
jgi:ParB family chromosome partitioning protein